MTRSVAALLTSLVLLGAVATSCEGGGRDGKRVEAPLHCDVCAPGCPRYPCCAYPCTPQCMPQPPHCQEVGGFGGYGADGGDDGFGGFGGDGGMGGSGGLGGAGGQ